MSIDIIELPDQTTAPPVLRPDNKVKRPPMYTCVILNDDWTSMEFVVMVLVNVFNLSRDEATATMLKVHKEGKANVGSYTYEVASHKAETTMMLARKHEYPLLVSPEAI